MKTMLLKCLPDSTCTPQLQNIMHQCWARVCARRERLLNFQLSIYVSGYYCFECDWNGRIRSPTRLNYMYVTLILHERYSRR